MKDKAVFYFFGNWKYIGGYIGEPQRTLNLLIEHLNRGNNKAEISSNLDKIKKTKNNYKVFVFGEFFPVCIRTLFCFISGISFANMRFILFKDKATFSDITFFLKNIGSFKRVRYLMNTSFLEAFFPRKLYASLVSAYTKKIFAVFFPTDIVNKSRIFLCSCLEETRLRQFAFVHNKNFNKREVRLLYFGRDSYLRGVDIIKELNGMHKGYNYLCIGIFPFKGFLSQAGLDSKYHIYDNSKNILERVKEATFTFFPFRAKFAGPDVPAALIESLLLGVPPVISKVLLFDILKRYNYPLVIDHVCADSIIKCIENNVRNNEDYGRIVNLCRLIGKEIVNKYSYNFSKLNV